MDDSARSVVPHDCRFARIAAVCLIQFALGKDDQQKQPVTVLLIDASETGGPATAVRGST